MNIKALLKALKLRKFATALLLLQLSLTLGLMVNTVLMTIDAKQKLATPVGFNVDNLIAVSLLPTSGQFRDTDYYISIAKQDMQKLSELEGVVSVSNYNQLPIQRGGMNGNLQDVNFPDDQILARDLNYVPFFLSGANGVGNLGVEIVEGRALTVDDDITQAYYSKNKDDKDIEWNVVITQSLAKAVYPDSSALGQLTNMGRIVGIAKDFAINPSKTGRGRHFGLFANFLYAQADSAAHYIIQVEPGQSAAVMAQVKQTILAVQPERDILELYSMGERLTKFFSKESGLAALFSMLCGLMIAITIISSFAHAHFHVSQQQKIIGIRRALGARKIDIMLYVFSENWLMTAGASLLGIGAVLAINIGLSQIITIDKPDVLLYVIGVMVIWLSGTLATWFPAYKTTKISPVVATQTL